MPKQPSVQYCIIKRLPMCDSQIEQLESEFGFGASVDGFLLTYNQVYRDTFLDNFAVSIYYIMLFSLFLAIPHFACIIFCLIICICIPLTKEQVIPPSAVVMYRLSVEQFY